eukprot:GHVT01050104.1.p1 GENE.GHVT01050104.1~~GHVT01050104.1.p1  ORF type:complete len:168 (+),score=32.02 GHVT01050104.1:742-1245(+)
MAGASNEVDEALRSWLEPNPSVTSYVLLAPDGIPIKHHESVPYETAVHIAALFSTFIRSAERCFRHIALDQPLLPGDVPNPSAAKANADFEIESIRLRVSDGTELIGVASAENYFIFRQACPRSRGGNAEAAESAATDRLAAAASTKATAQPAGVAKPSRDGRRGTP